MRINHWIFLMLLTAVPVSLSAQEQAKCVVTTESGSEITGYIKNYHSSYLITGGFTLRKGDRKMKIYPETTKKVVVNDTIVYGAIPFTTGHKSFMQLLEAGTPLNLYRHSIRLTGNMPNTGFTVWIDHKYFIDNGKEALYAKEKKVRKEPELFFPGGSPTFLRNIADTKRDDIDDHLAEWVREYNASFKD
ncbi:hypothetical protein GTQ34_16265 [Muricauda sp. JGD-17]|uniref:DUF4369 domain-containing protein n=1 Tax=Flagellimonas ochracea TaxID=2696472 RepID=A0A964TEP9_9FLAO|nr:hypothetical protein [Allomuricauda ochracea]NAY93467.1 hypothetical protein [Allomuricauda ochracea]